MTRTSLFSVSLALVIEVLCGGNRASAAEAILFSDSFSDVNGHVIGQTDGKIIKGGEAPTRHVLPFMGTSPLANGKLTISAYEDPIGLGPDGMPGVLAICFAEVPR